MATFSSQSAVIDSKQIARAVPLPSMMRHLGWKVQRGEKRADCGLCKGSSRGTVAMTDRLWRCHRCGAGGDCLTLVMRAERCDFLRALRFVADYAGIRLPTRNDDARFRRQVEHKRQQRERIDRSAEFLTGMERSLRLECRDKIHQCDRILTKSGPWDQAQWQRARAAHALLRDFLLPEYTLVAFGSMAERVRYVLANDGERANICGAIRIAGGVRTDGGYFMEGMG